MIKYFFLIFFMLNFLPLFALGDDQKSQLFESQRTKSSLRVKKGVGGYNVVDRHGKVMITFKRFGPAKHYVLKHKKMRTTTFKMRKLVIRQDRADIFVVLNEANDVLSIHATRGRAETYVAKHLH